MRAYTAYASRLDGLLDRIEWGRRVPRRRDEILYNLNGGAAEALRELVPASEVRRSGAFFTPEPLAQASLRAAFSRAANDQGSVLDPALGAGDLLLGWAQTLPVHRSLERTLDNWGALLFGFELHCEFISVAKRRLTLLAIDRGARLSGRRAPKWQSLFPQLRQSDVAARQRSFPDVSTVVMNPPFIAIPSPAGCGWAHGGVNAAAVFVDCVLSQSPRGQRIIAILPEVLRSGTRYGHWRDVVAERMSIRRCKSWGRFSDHADVDVFILDGVAVGPTGTHRKWPSLEHRIHGSMLRAVAEISVGPVVPHRHRETGQRVPYITARSLPAWKTVRDLQARRRFPGTLFTPPFVAVRRTSSPHDPTRAIGTVVAGAHPVAVENHLLVVTPLSGTLKDCYRILGSLRARSTTEWLNDRIRCRHLTVGILEKLPLSES